MNSMERLHLIEKKRPARVGDDKTHWKDYMIMAMRPPGPLVYGLKQLITHIPAGSVMLEIGSYTGESTEIFAKSNKFKSIYAVDAWELGDERLKNIPKDEGRQCSTIFDCRLSDYPNIKKVTGFSEDVIKTFPDDFFDFIYIDGDHTYDGVKSDFYNALKKVKYGGIIGGHDFQVNFGVYDFLMEFDQNSFILFEDTSWLLLNVDDLKKSN